MVFFNKNKEEFVEEDTGDYLSISEDHIEHQKKKREFTVKVFVMDDYDSIREILDAIREERTLCLIDIHLLRNKDPDELRRSVDKLKKTAEAVNGELVGFHENWVMATPKYVHIHKGGKP